MAGLAAVLALLVAGCWWATGGRWQTVATPSMGEAAPIGTLVLTLPVTAAEVRVGDIITFHSPVVGGRVYTHRVVDIDATGGLHTRGDINGANDPAILQSRDLVGKVVARWWGIGWLLKALPFLIVGGLVLWFVTRRWVPPSRRPAMRVLGSSILISVSAVMLKPFVNFAVVTNVPGERRADLTLVSTGLLPIRVEATGGARLDLVNGGIGELTASGQPGRNGYQLTSNVHLTLMWWVVLGLCWLTPLLVAMLFAPREYRLPIDVDMAPRTAPPSGGGRHVVRRSTLGAHRQPVAHSTAFRLARVLITVVGLVAALVPLTQSAFAGRVTNSTDTAASNPYFTCQAAVTSSSGPSFFAYPLSENTAFVLANDVSGNARNGGYNTGGVWSSTASRPCPRDTSTSAVVSGGSQTAQNLIAGANSVVNPTVFSIEIWFKTGANIGGRLIGFGNGQSTTSSQYDRHIYMTATGQLTFGVYPNNTVKVVTSPASTPSAASYADGQWHQAVGTLGSNGLRLYVDGLLVAGDNTVTGAENYTGYWRVGYDSLSGWTNQPSNFNFRGSLAWASVYPTTLPATLVQQHYAAGL